MIGYQCFVARGCAQGKPISRCCRNRPGEEHDGRIVHTLALNADDSRAQGTRAPSRTKGGESSLGSALLPDKRMQGRCRDVGIRLYSLATIRRGASGKCYPRRHIADRCFHGYCREAYVKGQRRTIESPICPSSRPDPQFHHTYACVPLRPAATCSVRN